MGSFLEKNIDWVKEEKRIVTFLYSVENLLKNSPYNFSETYLKKMLREINHFKKLFKEDWG